MKLLQIIIGLVALVIIWLGLSYGMLELMSSVTDEATAAEASYPFNHAHMIEEAAEGHYSPWTHKLFLLKVFVVAGFSFGLITFLLAKRIEPFYAVIPGAIFIIFLFVQFRYVWHSGFPIPMRSAFLIDIFVSLLFCIFGVRAGSRRSLSSARGG